MLGKEHIPGYKKNSDSIEDNRDYNENNSVESDNPDDNKLIESLEETQGLEKTPVTQDTSSVESLDVDSYISKFYDDDNFTNTQSSPSESDENSVSIALFALSLYNNDDKSRFIKDDKEYKYFYQLEPALLNERISLGKNGLDYIIALCTDGTLKKGENKEFRVGDECYEIDLSPLDFVERIARNSLLKEEKADKSESIINLDEKDEEYVSLYKEEDDLNERVIVVKAGDSSAHFSEKPENDNNARVISSTIRAIKHIKGDRRIIIHVYNNGGFRATQSNLESIVSLLEKDSDISVTKYDVQYEKSEHVTRIREMGNDVVDFVSGINEFRNYGKMNSLNKYYGRSGEKNYLRLSNNNDVKLMECLNEISYGIQSNMLDSFYDGISKLVELKENTLYDYYLSLFKEEIYDVFTFIGENGKDADYHKKMIRWSLDKGYYQQALTMIESLIPLILHMNNIFKYECDGEYINSIRMFKKQDDISAVFLKIVNNDECVNNIDYYDGTENPLKDGFIIDSSNPKGEVEVRCTDKLFRFLIEYKKLKHIRNMASHVKLDNLDDYSVEYTDSDLYGLMKSFLDSLDNDIDMQESLFLHQDIQPEIQYLCRVERISRNKKKRINIAVKIESCDSEIIDDNQKGTINADECEKHSLDKKLKVGKKVICSVKNKNIDIWDMQFVSFVK